VKRIGQIILVFIFLSGILLFWHWKTGAPKRAALASLQTFDQALNKGDAAAVLQILVLPQVVQGKTPAEQNEFLFKALRDEISAEGLAELSQRGQFGPLTNIFPQEAAQWASQAGAKPEECVAFRLDRTNGFRAEVVLHRPSTLDSRPSTPFKIIRCNNVKAMARLKLLQ
jgi:hypothetical protein